MIVRDVFHGGDVGHICRCVQIRIGVNVKFCCKEALVGTLSHLAGAV